MKRADEFAHALSDLARDAQEELPAADFDKFVELAIVIVAALSSERFLPLQEPGQ